MDKLTGCVPSNAEKYLPMFDGRQDRFEDFKFKAKATFLELELDVVTFKPVAEFRNCPLRRSRLAQVLCSQRNSLWSNWTATEASSAFNLLHSREHVQSSSKVARILISKLSS